MPDLGLVLSWVVPVFVVLGILSAFDAVMNVRNPQGATAWVVSLITIPVLAFIAYWLFGRVKYRDYSNAQERCRQKLALNLEDRDSGLLADFAVPLDAEDERTRAEIRAFEALAGMPLCRGHELKLLIDGQAAFDQIFNDIDAAEHYVLVQFFIVRDDDLGRALAQRLLSARARGCEVYMLYDEIGSYNLPQRYCQTLIDAGVQLAGFSGTRSLLGRFRLNFRNHRKIVVVDGHTGLMGGLNVGDEYLGRDESFGDWRDTHLRLKGPAVLNLQRSFVEDWTFGQESLSLPQLSWNPASVHAASAAVLNLASGPADAIESCGLLYAHSIESAERRLWIASPYFVPDPRVLSALQTAALRGVDVKILLPEKSDNPIFRFVPFAYLPDVEMVGAEVYLYQNDFMHQKVMLVDDCYACVSTANLDNRSFRLNFETSCVIKDQAFCADVARMLRRDLENCRRLRSEELTNHSWWFAVAVAVTRLMSPVL